MNYTAYLAEFFGTFLLLISILATGNALIIGLTLALVIFLVGGLSGAHVNPAVSAAMLLNGSLSVNEFIIYAIVQIAGGLSAVYVFNALA
jgi:aquaporin Z